jgi:arylsulfatase
LDPGKQREMVAAYYATLEHLDAEFGRLLDHLDRNGQRENTIVVFTSDHGDMLGDHGLTAKGAYFYDPVVRVPLVFSWPGRVRGGEACDAFVELVDIAPTLLALCGVDVPGRMQGRSFVPLLEGPCGPDDHRDGVYCEFLNTQPEPDENRSICATMWRNRRHKLVVHHGDELGELYDLELDPGEHINCWNAPAYADVKAALTRRLLDAIALQADPEPPRVAGF